MKDDLEDLSCIGMIDVELLLVAAVIAAAVVGSACTVPLFVPCLIFHALLNYCYNHCSALGRPARLPPERYQPLHCLGGYRLGRHLVFKQTNMRKDISRLSSKYSPGIAISLMLIFAQHSRLLNDEATLITRSCARSHHRITSPHSVIPSS